MAGVWHLAGLPGETCSRLFLAICPLLGVPSSLRWSDAISLLQRSFPSLFLEAVFQGSSDTDGLRMRQLTREASHKWVRRDSWTTGELTCLQGWASSNSLRSFYR